VDAEDVRAGDQVLHLVTLEARVDQVHDARGQEADQAAGVGLADLPRPRQQTEQIGERPDAPVEGRRRLEEEGLEVGREPLDLGVEREEGARVTR
jgi:hypothetical protein